VIIVEDRSCTPRFISSIAMQTLNRVGTWILTHPQLVTAIAVTAFVVAMFVVMPALGVAPRGSSGGGGKPCK